MIPRATAWLLIVLAVSPFTAPFSTCELSTFMARPDARGMTFIQRSASVEQSGTQSPTASLLDEDQFKNVSLSAITTCVPGSVVFGHVSAPVRRTSNVRTPLLTLRL